MLSVVPSGLTQQEQNQKVRVQNFGAASRIYGRWFPAPLTQVGMEKFAYGVAAIALSRGPGSFGIFLRFCEAIVAMKKFAYGVNACEIRAASPKGGPAKLVFGYHFHYNTNRLKCQAKFLKKPSQKSSSYSRSFSNCSL